jgi:low specificity L-threonine aldolase|uniref:threonine aldolase family protein n=1 Tax=Prevotella sp. TaxID=59823 RepID=UPI004028A3DC
MIRASFESDYNNGCLPEILRRLSETNDEKSSGYGFDPYTERAKDRIRKACEMTEAEVHFLVGGTQTNATAIDSLLQGCEGVLSVDTGHINVHESGAVEAFGHKVLVLPGIAGGKMAASQINDYMRKFLADETYPHMVQPGMVYITLPTELGALYSRKELADIYTVCQQYGLRLYVDGARLGYGLMAEGNDIDLPFLAHHCDVFYIGGTKVGALLGEALVYTNTRAPKYIFTIIKRHGALLAKGRVLGLQFDTLFTDDLYFRVSRHAIDMAQALRKVFAKHGLSLGIDSPTNQQFVILSKEQKQRLAEEIAFEIWEPLPNDHLLCRFVTCWATTEADIAALDEALKRTLAANA